MMPVTAQYDNPKNQDIVSLGTKKTITCAYRRFIVVV